MSFSSRSVFALFVLFLGVIATKPATSQVWAGNELIVAVADFPPQFVVAADGSLSGTGYDRLVTALNFVTPNNYQIITLPNRRLYRDLAAGRVHMSIGPSAQIKIPQIARSSETVDSIELVVLHRAGTRAISDIRQLIGNRLVTYWAHENSDAFYYLDTNASLEFATSSNSALDMLRAGRVDYILDFEDSSNRNYGDLIGGELQRSKLADLGVYVLFPADRLDMIKMIDVMTTLDRTARAFGF